MAAGTACPGVKTACWQPQCRTHSGPLWIDLLKIAGGGGMMTTENGKVKREVREVYVQQWSAID